MKLLKKAGLTFIIVLLTLSALSFLLPSEFALTRSIVINAPAETIFPHLANLKKTQAWSPWRDYDPDMKVTFSGPASGIGATTRWSSKQHNVGSGSLKIVKSVPGKLVENHLDFGDEGTATARLLLCPVKNNPQATRVTWGFVTRLSYNPVERWMAVLFFDRWIGNDYEKGLKKLKKIMESR